MRVGVSFPQSFCTGPAVTGRLLQYLERVDELGFDSVWTQEQLLGRDPSLEPVNSLAFAAAATSRARLGTATIVAPLRGPVHLAKSLATIDRLSEGRLIVGLSIGELQTIFDAAGVPLAERVSRLEEVVAAMRILWSDLHPSFEGRHWRFGPTAMEPKPAQRAGPPIWLGAHARPAVERAARLGDGWIGAGGSSIDEFAERAGWVEEALAARDRDRSEFTIVKKLYVSIDRDADSAKERLAEWFTVHWPREFDPVSMAARVGVSGTEDDLRKAVDRVADIGADLVILNPVFDETEQLERFASVVEDRLDAPTR